jgi:hypothetical protein
MNEVDWPVVVEVTTTLRVPHLDGRVCDQEALPVLN